MTNIYGVPDEVGGYPPIYEPDDKPDCPYCNSTVGIVFVRFEDGGVVEVYKCHTCDTIFKIKTDIPF